MTELPASITIVLAVLAVFLILTAALKYMMHDDFARARMLMTAFFLFIVVTLTIAFGQYAWATLPFSIPATLVGMVLGYFIGVKTERQKLEVQGLSYYLQHFAHIHATDLQALTWWSFVNFYSIMGGLLLINLVGLSTVIFPQAEDLALATSAVGAFLLGTIVPYLLYLWSISTTQKSTSTTSEA